MEGVLAVRTQGRRLALLELGQTYTALFDNDAKQGYLQFCATVFEHAPALDLDDADERGVAHGSRWRGFRSRDLERAWNMLLIQRVVLASAEV